MITRCVLVLGAWFVLVGQSVAQDWAPMPVETAVPYIAEAPAYGGTYGVSERFWVETEAPLAWLRATPLPPLVTTSPPGTAVGAAGVLGNAGTTVLTPTQVNDDVRLGFGLSAGYLFGADLNLCLEVGVTVLESQASLFSASSTGTPILAQPFTNAVTKLPEAVLIAFPGTVSGAVDIRSRSGNFYEGHVDLTEAFYDSGAVRLSSIFGYRYYRYDESLVSRAQRNSPAGLPAGTVIVSTDEFGAQNEFHGLDLGLRARFASDTLALQLLAKAAVGQVHHKVGIRGAQLTTSPGVPAVAQVGGIYALSSNIGTFDDNDWAVVPEFGAKGSWQIAPGCKLQLGYSLLWLSNTARAADQVNLNINKGLFPPVTSNTPNEPSLRFRDADVWIQSVNLGIQFSF